MAVKKKDAYYFKHDANAHRDPKILKLRNKFGAAGVGIYWMIVENLREQDQYMYEKDGYNIMLTHLTDPFTDKRKVVAISKYCITIGLLLNNNNFIYTKALCRRMEPWDNMKEGGKRGAHAKWGKDGPSYDPPYGPPDASTVEESTVEERRGEESTEKENFSFDGIHQPEASLQKKLRAQQKIENFTPEVREVRDYFYEVYRDKVKIAYASMKPDKERQIIKDLLDAKYSIPDLKALIDKFFASDDEFISSSAYTISVFRAVLYKIAKGKVKKESPLDESDRIRQERIAKREQERLLKKEAA
jgi:Domain of unknown function (DUF4373)